MPLPPLTGVTVSRHLMRGQLLIVALLVSLASGTANALDVLLAWDPPSGDEELILHYNFYVDNGSGPRLFDILPAWDDLKYRIRGLVPGVRYHFHVTATSIWGESDPSNVVQFGDFGEPPPDKRRSIQRGNAPSPFQKPTRK